MSWRSIAEQYYARIAELEAQVAHFQTEYQDEIGRTELIENVETAKAEIAELEAQVAWSAARIAELEGAKK
jgi:uncharacterized coiled-coil protein SlyX